MQRSDFFIALATLVATVTIRIDIAILLGTLLALMTYLHRTSHPSMHTMGFRASDPNRHFAREGAPHELPECPPLKLLCMEGLVYFGVVAHRLQAWRVGPDAPKHLLIRAKSMNFIHHAGALMGNRSCLNVARWAATCTFIGPGPRCCRWGAAWDSLRIWASITFSPDEAMAIAQIYERLELEICATCTARIFRECNSRHS